MKQAEWELSGTADTIPSSVVFGQFCLMLEHLIFQERLNFYA